MRCQNRNLASDCRSNFRIVRAIRTAVLLSLFGCGSSSNTENSDSTSTQPSGDSESRWPTPYHSGKEEAESEESPARPTSPEVPDKTEDANFVSPDDPVDSRCDIWSQDCPEGEKCSYIITDGSGVWTSTRCVPIVESPDGVDEECDIIDFPNGLDSCDVENVCRKISYESKVGICVPYCSGSPDDPTCPEGYSCEVQGQSGIAFCLRHCDPLSQDCPSVLACHMGSNGDDFNCTIDGSDNKHPVGSACMSLNQCNRGLICVQSKEDDACSGYACCTPYCNLNEASSCEGLSDSPVECMPIFEEGVAPSKVEHVGYCDIPDEYLENESTGEGSTGESSTGGESNEYVKTNAHGTATDSAQSDT